MTKGQINRAESKFDKLSNEIAKDYEKKGKSKKEADKIGNATAYKIGVAKYGKRGMERKARAGRAMNAESFGADEKKRRGMNIAPKIQMVNYEDVMTEKMKNQNMKDAETFEANAGGLKCNVCQNMVADTDGDKYFVCDTCANDEGMGAESFGAESCEGQEQNDRGFCDLRFDYGSSGITSECKKCGDELEWTWDDNEYDNEEIERASSPGQSRCVLGDDGYCSIEWDWGTGRAYGTCIHCNSEYEFSFPDTPIGIDDDDEEFGLEDMWNDWRGQKADEKTKVTNITNVGNKVIVTMDRNDIYEGSMDDVMLNNYTNSRGQEIRFNGEEVPEGFHKMPDGTIMADSAHGAEEFDADGMDFKEAAKTGFGIAAGFTLFNVSLFGIAAVAGIVMSKK